MCTSIFCNILNLVLALNMSSGKFGKLASLVKAALERQANQAPQSTDRVLFLSYLKIYIFGDFNMISLNLLVVVSFLH